MEPIENETWRPVLGYEGLYEVSNHGRVKSVAREVRCNRGTRTVAARVLRTSPHKLGYRLVCLARGGGKSTRSVHALVLEAFVGPRPDGLVACHGDGDPTNNHLENLRWDTQSNNLYDAVRHGTNRLAAAARCKRDHEFTPANTYVDGKGWRRCRQCVRDYGRRRRLAA